MDEIPSILHKNYEQREKGREYLQENILSNVNHFNLSQENQVKLTKEDF